MTKFKDEAAFFDKIRAGKLLGPKLDQDEVSGCQAITDACGKASWPIAWTAYALATAYHETAHTMQPVKEFGGASYFKRMYDVTGNRPKLAKSMGNTDPGDGAKFYGRGYVQLTWRSNYEKAEKKLGIKGLVANPDLALTVPNSSAIMIAGMEGGWFTGVSCNTYLPRKSKASKAQFTAARRIINGLDKAELIAGYAEHFQEALASGGWS